MTAENIEQRRAATREWLHKAIALGPALRALRKADIALNGEDAVFQADIAFNREMQEPRV